MLAAMRRASSRVSSLPVARRPGSFSKYTLGQCLTVVVADDETTAVVFLDVPGLREAASRGVQS